MEHAHRAEPLGRLLRLPRQALPALGYAAFVGLCCFLCHLYLPGRLGLVAGIPHALLVSLGYAAAHLFFGLRRGRALGWAEPHALLLALPVGLLSFAFGLHQSAGLGLASAGWALLGGVIYPLLVSGVIPIFLVLIATVIDDLRRPIV